MKKNGLIVLIGFVSVPLMATEFVVKLNDDTKYNIKTEEPVEPPLPPSLTPKLLDCGSAFCLAVDKNGDLWGYGSNNYGQLLNNESNLSKWTKLKKPGNGKIKEIITTYYTSYVLNDDGNVYATGYNGYGQIGNGNKNNVNQWYLTKTNMNRIFGEVNSFNLFGLDKSNKLMAVGCNDYQQMGLTEHSYTSWVNIPISGLNGVQYVANTYEHTVIIDNSGKSFAAGDLDSLTGDTANNYRTFQPYFTGIKKATVGIDHTTLLMNNGLVKTIGRNKNGSIGNGNSSGIQSSLYTAISSSENIQNIEAGTHNNIAFTKNGEVIYFGANGSGQAGDGSTSNVLRAKKIKTPVKVKSVVAAGNGSVILGEDNNYYMTGFNTGSNWNKIELK